MKHPLDGFESIAPGSVLAHRMTLSQPTAVHAGLLVAALAEMARSPYLGGHRNVGCGLFSASYEVKEWMRGDLQARTIGRIDMTTDSFDLDCDRLNEAHQQYIVALPSCDFHVVSP